MIYFSLSKQNQTGQIEHEVGEILNQEENNCNSLKKWNKMWNF